MITMMSAAAKLSVVAISCFVVACCAAESRMIDVASYTNHRTSSKNDTPNKYPVYSAQVYADLSNIKDYTAADTEQPKSTETPLDVVRIYITPATVKKRLDAQQAAVPTTQPPPATVTSMSRTSPHPMVFVTAANGPDHRDQRSGAVYSVSSTVNVYKEPADYRTSTVAESGRKSDGAKAKQAVKAQSQSQHLLYATTQSPLSPQPTFAVAASKAQPTNSSSVSKPFATVLVPKQMLDGGDSVVGYSVREDSFRPIAAPLYSYRPNAVDSNSVPDNRRMSAEYYNVANAAQTASVPAKSVNSGYAKSDAYKVLEEHGPYEERSSDRSFNVVPANKQLRDKPNHQQPYVDRPLQTTENPVKRDHAKPPKDALPQKHYGVVPEKSAHRYAGPEPSKYDKVQPYKSVPPKSSAEQVREFYPATEVPARDAMSYSPYNSAGKYDARSPPLLPWEREKSPGSPPNKVLSGPSTWSTVAYPGPAASGGAEFAMDDVNAKDVLKSILRDMLKSKQQAEVKQPSKSAAGTDEFVDSYFKINPVDLSFDSSDVETDLSCNLQSTKYITDGQCMTTKPIVEAVCADRCLVYNSMGPSRSFSQRQRSSMLTIKQDIQVEALHCVDGDMKFERVQLKCRDGNMINNVIKVVTNCRCKLHQIQPQMRNTRDTGSSNAQQSGVPNPDIMKIATGKF